MRSNIYSMWRGTNAWSTPLRSNERPRKDSRHNGRPARQFKDFTSRIRESWSRERRVIADVRSDAANQLQQTRAAGCEIDQDNVIKNEGVSPSMCFAERDGGRHLHDKLRAGDALVVRRLERQGRPYDDVRDTALMRKGMNVRTALNNVTFDGSQTDLIQNAIPDALLAFMSAIGQGQTEATKHAQQAGIAHAQTTERVYLGRKLRL
jgi:putative DNA-invertase from lambdoid prophage Rac